jgi:BirA family biotin operon repressor/biotin-[acetyl-CoA-carboxylase] ligase
MKQRNLKFRRQHAVHPYIADFACMAARLLIELDGYSHDARQGYDAGRDAYLRQKGFFILRFGNDEVLGNVEGVAEAILNHAERLVMNMKAAPALHSPLPDPPHEGAGTLPRVRANEGKL